MPDHAILLEDNESEPGSPQSTTSTMMTAPSHVDLTDDETASSPHDSEAPPPPYSAAPPPALPPRMTKTQHDRSKALYEQPSSSTPTSTSPSRPQPTQTQVLQGHTLSPSSRDDGDKPKLLLVFIHGFMGDETSFQSFPIHVHDLVSVLLFDSHAVYTKVYPRYRSKGRVDATARDFSNWLSPHESPDTDVILIGHSMGGILTAEVALLPAETPDSPTVLRHRIVGTISLDAPLLGMHPGIITSGISSLFRRDTAPVAAAAVVAAAASTQLSPQTSASSASAASTSRTSLADSLAGSAFEKNFNQPFYNDIRLPVREGWKNAWHFISKHSENITAATQKLLYSHAEFGACLADFEELKVRYCRIRMLEEPDEGSRQNALDGHRPPPRVRFVNYYTASTGRHKPAVPTAGLPAELAGAASLNDGESGAADQLESIATSSLYSRIDLEELDPRAHEPEAEPELEHDHDHDHKPEPGIESKSEPEPSDTSSNSDSSDSSSDSHSILTPAISSPAEPADITPVIPAYAPPSVSSPPSVPVPPLPTLPRFSNYPDKATYKQALQSYKQAVKAHHQALATNIKLDAERRKAELKLAKLQLKSPATSATDKTAAKAAARLDKAAGKREKHAAKAAAKHARANAKSAAKDERRSIKSAAKDERRAAKAAKRHADPPSAAAASLQAHLDTPSSSARTAAPERERRFCILPPADSTGAQDPCWLRVRMDGVDEVGAHCGLFFPRDPGDPGDEVVGGADGGEGWGERYSWLVRDVAERIEGWALAAADERMSRALAERG